MSEQRPTYKNTILNEFRMRLIGSTLQGADRPPTLTFKVKKNRPHVSVWTNLPNDKNKGMIEADLDFPSFEVLLGLMESIESLPPGENRAIKCLDQVWAQGGPSKDLKPISKVVVGREADGTAFLSVLSWDSTRPVIKFPIRPSRYHQFIKADGSPMDEQTASLLYAPAWARVLRGLIWDMLRTEYVPPKSDRPSTGRPPAPQEQQGTPPATNGDGWGNDDWPM